MPAILQYVWLSLTVVLTLTGLASIVEGFVIWVDFFAQFIEIYKVTLRDPMSVFVHAFWPTSWPKIPKLLFDILIVWTAFFSALRLFWAREGKWLKRSTNARASWPVALLLGPFIISYYSVKYGAFLNNEDNEIDGRLNIHETGEDPLSMEGVEALRKRRQAIVCGRKDMRNAFRRLVLYYILLFSSFTLLLFINYQIRKLDFPDRTSAGRALPASLIPQEDEEGDLMETRPEQIKFSDY